jgi:hypothetical protein
MSRASSGDTYVATIDDRGRSAGTTGSDCPVWGGPSTLIGIGPVISPREKLH